MKGLLLILSAFTVALLFAGQVRAEDAPAPEPAAEAKALAGRWVRSDYPYVIEIASVQGDGTLSAAYFNPRPINVGSARYEETVAGPVVTVVLQDTNYPGSTYSLTYDRTRDLLVGTYFQAVQGQTFGVIFVREK